MQERSIRGNLFKMCLCAGPSLREKESPVRTRRPQRDLAVKLASVPAEPFWRAPQPGQEADHCDDQEHADEGLEDAEVRSPAGGEDDRDCACTGEDQTNRQRHVHLPCRHHAAAIGEARL